jgi:hypothetical protein
MIGPVCTRKRLPVNRESSVAPNPEGRVLNHRLRKLHRC